MTARSRFAALFAATMFALTPFAAAEHVRAAAADIVETEVTLKGADGEDVTTVVYRDPSTGNWVLGSPIRNIYAVDLTESVYDPVLPPDTRVIADSATGFTDGVVVSAYSNAVKAYDFYTKEHIGTDFFGVNGNNDKIAGTSGREEFTILVYAHDGGEAAAAFALFPGRVAEDRINEGHLRVGEGGEEIALPALALDVIAHEYHHGVTTHFLTGNTYGGETGALKEAFSDVFGSLVEGHGLDEEAFWTIGEDGMPVGKPYLRSMKDPQAPYVADMEHKYTGERDRGGEHYNSTIISHLNYRIYAQIPEVLTGPVVGRLWFRTLQNLSGKSEANFADFTAAFRGAAEEIPEEEGVLTAEGKEKLKEAVDDALFAAGLYEPDDVCTVTFTDADGHVLKTERVRAGGTATPPEAPSKAPDEGGHYVFSGWNGTYTNVQQSETVRAEFALEEHVFGPWQETPATCEDAGERRASCACGYEKTEEIPAKGHSFGDWTLSHSPTYTEEGSKTRTCSQCGKTETQSVPALGLKQKFLDETAALPEVAPGDLLAALRAANETYGALTEAEKAEVSEAYAALLALVHAYNEEAEALNRTFDGVYRAGIGGLDVALTLAAGAALLTFKRRWRG